MLVQDLLVAKCDLRLSKEIKKLARYDGLIIDDMGYVQQSREEMEVLFNPAGRALRARQRAAEDLPATATSQ
jgi:DNA replication protein DnaC